MVGPEALLVTSDGDGGGVAALVVFVLIVIGLPVVAGLAFRLYDAGRAEVGPTSDSGYRNTTAYKVLAGSGRPAWLNLVAVFWLGSYDDPAGKLAGGIGVALILVGMGGSWVIQRRALPTGLEQE